MSNVTVTSDEYTNIQGVAVKKIKLTGKNLNTLMNEGKKVRAQVKMEFPKEVEELKNIEKVKPELVEEPKHEEDIPLYLHNRESKLEFDETALKERVAENYKNLANFETKSEKKPELVQKPNLNEKISRFERLLNTDVIIMQDKMDMFRKVFDEKQLKLKNAKQEQARYADSYRKMTNDEQAAKVDKELKEDRIKKMNNKDHFAYLTIGDNESGEVVEAISMVNESLKNLYNVNQVMYKEIVSKIEKYEFDKKEINKASERVGVEIHKYIDELNEFVDEKAPLLEEIIRIDNQYKDAQKESDRAIKDEYDAITEVENERVGINLNIPGEINQAIEQTQNNIPNLNIFENFRRAASEGGDEAAVDINDAFINNYEKQPVGYGRTA